MAKTVGKKQNETEVERVVGFLEQTEGRDKLTKCLQYGCRMLAWILLDANKDISQRLEALYKTSADSRKIFRLGKFLNEYVKLKALALKIKKAREERERLIHHEQSWAGWPGGGGPGALQLEGSTGRSLSSSPSGTDSHHSHSDSHPHQPNASTAADCFGALASCREAISGGSLQFLSRAGFLAYWVFDGLNILSKIRVFKSNTQKLNKKAASCWFFGLAFGLLFELYRLKRSLDREIALQQRLILHDTRLNDDASAEARRMGDGKKQEAVESVASSSSSSSTEEWDLRRRTEPGGRATRWQTPSVSGGVGNAEAEMDSCEIEKRLLRERAERKTYIINIAKNLGDLVTASNIIEIPHRVLGRGFNDGIVGASGLLSAVLSCFQLYSTSSK